MSRSYLFFILFFISGISLFAQGIRCYSCGLLIEGEYISVEGHWYHPNDFLCAACRLPIHGSYKKVEKNFLHKDCPIKNKPEEIVENCIICDEPLEDLYSIDAFQNQYHREHEKEYSKCSNCGRLICKAITNGGITYGDSREMCSICYKDALFLQTDYNLLLKKVINILTHNGIDLSKENIVLKAVNSFELKQEGGFVGKVDNLKGFCKPSKLPFDSSKTDYKIFVLSGLPSISTEAIMVHELMHAWIFVNTENQNRSIEIEGICNYVAFRYLQISKDPGVPMEMKKIEQDPDITYGKSFRDIRQKFGDKPMANLLDYIKTSNVTIKLKTPDPPKNSKGTLASPSKHH